MGRAIQPDAQLAVERSTFHCIIRVFFRINRAPKSQNPRASSSAALEMAKGSKNKGKSAGVSSRPKPTDAELAEMKKQDCRRWFFGRWSFGDRCWYKHDPKKYGTDKGNTQNNTSTDEDLIVSRPVR